MKLLTRKAQTGVSLIIMFIATLFVAAVAAGIFITTENDLGAKSKETGDQVMHDVSAIFFVMDIVGSDGSDGTIEEFRQIIKLPPGSQPVNLAYLNVVFNSENATASLQYAGVGADLTLGNSGFNTRTSQEIGAIGDYFDSVPQVDGTATVTMSIDLDLDGTNDDIVVCEDGRGFCPNGYGGQYIKFELSTAGDYFVRIVDENQLGMSITIKNSEVYGNYLSTIGTYGYITLVGDEGVAGSHTIFADQIKVYLTPTILTEDPDGDGQDDSLVINDTHVIVHYSSNGDILDQLNDTIGNAYPLGSDLSGGSQTLSTTIILTETDANPSYGTIAISGTTTIASYIDAGVNFLVTPYELNKGTYAAYHVQRSADYQEGVIRDGDIVRLYYETPHPIPEDEEIHITLITRGGGVTRTEFFMPNILARESVTLYPS